jgi:hypothetical protein
MRYVLIIANNVNEQIWVRRMTVVEVANSVYKINSNTLNHCGPSIVHINISLQAFKDLIFVLLYRGVSYNRKKAREDINNIVR